MLTIDNIAIPFSRLRNVRIASSFSGMGLSGVSRATLTADILLNGESFSQAAKCVLSDTDGKYAFPNFYINQRKKSGNVLTISAIDRCIALGRDFDCSSLSDDGESVLISEIVTQIASQCGFDGVSYSGGAVTELPADYVRDKTCESVLNSITELSGGFWAVRRQVSGDVLTLKRWAVYDGLVTASAASKVTVSSEKGPISRVIAKDTIESETFDTLGSADFSQTLKTSADYMTMAQVESILTAYSGKMFYGWSAKAEIDAAVELGYSYADGDVSYPVGSYTMIPHIGGLGAEIGASDYSESEWDYYGGEVSKKLAKKLTASTRYGTVSIDAGGIKVHGRYS